MRTLMLLAALCLPGLVAADEAPPAAKTDDGFEKIDASMMQRGESIPANRLVGAAYGFFLVAFVGYAVSVARRTRRVQDEVEAMTRKLEAKK